MVHKALFHLHYSILPLFDRDNERLKENIKKYIVFLKKNGITIADFTWHTHLFCHNPKLDNSEVSYLKKNLHPLEIFKLVKAEAARSGITIIPTLETTCYIDNDLKKKAHFLVMHENEDVLYGSELVYRRYYPYENFFEAVPKDATVIIAHPWRFRNGLAYYLGAAEANRIIEKYGVLAEYNGWIYPWYYLMNKIAKTLPFLRKIKAFENFRLLAGKNFTLENLAGYVPFYGVDFHAPHLLLGDTGYTELEIDGSVSTRKILGEIKRGRLKCHAPADLKFWRSVVWMARELGLAIFRRGYSGKADQPPGDQDAGFRLACRPAPGRIDGGRE